MSGIDWRIYEAGHCTHPECATRRGAPLASIRYPALAFLLQHPQQGSILFDTGYSEHFLAATRHLPERLYRAVTPVHLRSDEPLQRQLARDGFAADTISRVVISHLHGDHIGGVRDFPGAALICSRAAWDDMHTRGRLGSLRRGLLPDLLPEDFLDRVSWIEDAPRCELPRSMADFGAGHDLLGDGSLLAVSLPGHAEGQYGLLFTAASGATTFLVADAAWSSQAIRDGVPPPGLVTRLLGDTKTYRDTLQRLHTLAHAAPAIRLLPSHCNEWRTA
ncbi:MBL fold metallo-hydrolase [Rhodanobacter sp. AS-Z3]|uniref:MBL fold metallo-hydrolase n=1 Tax=Rhodanobacter sp. AS-Z3 TaxID=3031330 RepID=UPI0024784C2B|nr:MBL fold metallo-hydrolase [Rhodanobacter sp. AS-Z3]WEN16357.1 MBL fold metallo-hydrolase [Rhodanobacter sp. AS-Z3]